MIGFDNSVIAVTALVAVLAMTGSDFESRLS